MTTSEKQVWVALYATAWFQSAGGPLGHVTDEKRAEWCARQANRALDALKLIADPSIRQRSSDVAIEVLRDG